MSVFVSNSSLSFSVRPGNDAERTSNDFCVRKLHLSTIATDRISRFDKSLLFFSRCSRLFCAQRNKPFLSRVVNLAFLVSLRSKPKSCESGDEFRYKSVKSRLVINALAWAGRCYCVKSVLSVQITVSIRGIWLLDKKRVGGNAAFAGFYTLLNSRGSFLFVLIVSFSP